MRGERKGGRAEKTRKKTTHPPSFSPFLSFRVEHAIETAYREKLERGCYLERVAAARAARSSGWGRAAAAAEPAPMPACEALVDHFGDGGRG